MTTPQFKHINNTDHFIPYAGVCEKTLKGYEINIDFIFLESAIRGDRSRDENLAGITSQEINNSWMMIYQ